MSGYVLLLPCFIETLVFNANSVDPDQTPHSAASDMGLHFLSMSLLGDVRYKWVKMYIVMTDHMMVPNGNCCIKVLSNTTYGVVVVVVVVVVVL